MSPPSGDHGEGQIAPYRYVILIFGKDVFTSKNVLCLDTGADKDEALAPYKDSGMWWIEDKTANAELGASMGLNTLLINHGHNQSCEDSRITRVANWAEICNSILES